MEVRTALHVLSGGVDILLAAYNEGFIWIVLDNQ